MSTLAAIEGREFVMDDGARVALPEFLSVEADGVFFVGADGKRRGIRVCTGTPRHQIDATLEWLGVHYQKYGRAAEQP